MVSVYLETIQPELENIARLFGVSAEGLDFAVTEEDGCYLCRFTDGDHAALGRVPIPDHDDPRLRELHRKRAARRLCKQTLYDLLREATGIHPPWGSLSGVRPTHMIYEGLAAGLSLEAAANRLIREFDVTEEKARLLTEIVRVQSALPAPGDEWIDVYVGIPFCTTRCAYCSFSSGELGRGELVEPYLAALFRELDAGRAILRESGKRLRAVYVGGGTPTALTEDQLRRLLDRLTAAFPGASEYTVEAGRPDTITPLKLRAIREAGVQRVSINPQTMNERTLAVIGRAHTVAQVYEAYDMARAEGLRHINMDVIAGLPGETVDDFAHTMAAARSLRPESLTVHTLAIKRSSRMHLENAPLPDGAAAARMVDMGRETARELGLEPYYIYRQKHMAGNLENVGYALPGHACQYNVDIMEENTHILALGAGGISKRVFPEEGHIERAPNVLNIGEYIARVDEMARRKRVLFLGEGA